MAVFWGQAILDWVDVVAVFGQALALTASCVVAFYYNDLYDLRITRTFPAFAVRLVQAVGVAFILLAVVYAAFPDSRLAQYPFIGSFLVIAVILLPLRAALYAVMRHGPFVERVLILGTGRLAQGIVEEIEAQPHVGCAVVGALHERSGEVSLVKCPILGPVGRLRQAAAQTRAHRVIVALAERRGRLPVTELLDCQSRDVLVEDGVAAYERLSGKVALEWLSPSTLLFSDELRRSRRYLRMASAATRLMALVGFIVSLPAFVLIAIAIRLDTPGPILFVQERIGLLGKPFRLLKFRTMRVDAGPASEWARDNTTRITRVGTWLRMFRLDELPQLINIMRGDMNLVGPRPHPVSNLALFTQHIPHYALRCRLRPGVTGWAQIRFGYANNLEEEIEKMRFDLYYIKHVSFSLDLRILFDTVKIVLLGRGSRAADAYRVEPVAGAVAVSNRARGA
jgi:exopolysaccharide biosynthesis polyprenyl glycosylphosphotransferase